MNIQQIATVFGAFALVVLPAVTSANTYQYISTSGSLQSVQADNAMQALATAPNLAANSGVILVGSDGKLTPSDNTNPTNTNPTSGSFYQYINTDGNVQSIDTTSASVAIATATNIAPHSGVILVTNSSKLTN